jgi:hypothetical protein
MDTARYKYLQVWVAAGDLWAAMNTIDADAKTSRGFASGDRGVSGELHERLYW